MDVQMHSKSPIISKWFPTVNVGLAAGLGVNDLECLCAIGQQLVLQAFAIIQDVHEEYISIRTGHSGWYLGTWASARVYWRNRPCLLGRWELTKSSRGVTELGGRVV
jgi:hypothetical protein